MAEIRHLENRHDVNFFCWGWSDLDKIFTTGAEWHVDCGDRVKIETIIIPIRRTFGRIPWHVIPEPPATLQGAATGRIQCHDPRTMSHCRVLPPGEFNGMSSQSHVSHCKVLPLGEFTVTIPVPHATLQGVIIPSAILKSFSPYFFVFQCSLGFDERRLSYRFWYTFCDSHDVLFWVECVWRDVTSLVCLFLCIHVCWLFIARQHTRNIDTGVLSFRHAPILYRNGLTYSHNFFTTR